MWNLSRFRRLISDISVPIMSEIRQPCLKSDKNVRFRAKNIYAPTAFVGSVIQVTPKINQVGSDFASVPSGCCPNENARNTNDDAVRGFLTGLAYDTITYVMGTIAHIEELTGTNARDYPYEHATTIIPIRNVGVPNAVFVAIGLSMNKNTGNIECPVLAHNKVTGEWIFANNVCWDNGRHGFCWDSGTYTTEKTARSLFNKACGCDGKGVLYHTEEY